MPAEQSRGSPKKRMIRRVRKYLLHYLLLLLFCLAIAFIMCYTVFFKLDKIKISGCTMYSESQIVDEIGAQKGDSLFQINISNAEKRLLGKMPYLRSVTITRQFPTTLKVDIVEETVLGAVYTADGFAVISDTGKVLQTGVLSLPEGTPRIVGLQTQNYDTGTYLNESVSSGGGLQKEILALQKLSQQLKANDFTDITYYDVSDLLNLKVMIEDRLLLELGGDTELDYKCSFIRGVLDGKASGDEKFESVPEEGVLNFSNPPALRTMSMSIDKVKNAEAYLDFGVEAAPTTDNVVGGQESEPLAPQTGEKEETDTDSATKDQQEAAEPPVQPQTDTAQNDSEQGVDSADQTATNTGGGEVSTNTVGGQVVSNAAGEEDSTTRAETESTAGVQSSTASQAPESTGNQQSSDTEETTISNGSDVYNDTGRAPVVN